MSSRKKTPFQKHREEEEAKKKRAEDETARLYQEFVESFQVDDVPGSKAFVRGGVINPNEKLKNDSEGMYHLSYHLLWQLRVEIMKRRRRRSPGKKKKENQGILIILWRN
nr:protein RRC1-like isoform X1 [Ipomoea batatas]GMD53620.1 protein RRC1-like isoform X1 [Ipomoea batatas]GMD56558.1 protein RRC1-like isoform X1 [Ipomoea batatas]GMD58462.1 protein RRC1-like isoform X1 [Ipomoea batatas]